MRNSPLHGCLNWFGLTAGLVVGGGFVYKWLTDQRFSDTIGTVGLIVLGVALVAPFVLLLYLSLRHVTAIIRFNVGPGATNYRVNLQQPQLPPQGWTGPYSPQLPAPASFPQMPEMPEMPFQRDWQPDEADNYPPSA